MVSSKLLALGASALVAGLIGGLLIAAAVPGIVPAKPSQAADPPGTVLAGADEPQVTPCAWASNPFEGVDAEEQAELELIAACGDLKGTVQDITVVIRDETRQFHFTLLPDAGYTSMANADNAASLKGGIMIELELSEQSIISRLHVGEHLQVQGPLVKDIDHGWNEIHPAKIVTVLA